MELELQLRSVQDVLDFVSLATSRPFPIHVGNAHHWVNGKSFMELLCLDFSCPVIARLEASREEFDSFRFDARRFLGEEANIG